MYLNMMSILRYKRFVTYLLLVCWLVVVISVKVTAVGEDPVTCSGPPQGRHQEV